jgi:hypothetical protein
MQEELKKRDYPDAQEKLMRYLGLRYPPENKGENRKGE